MTIATIGVGLTYDQAVIAEKEAGLSLYGDMVGRKIAAGLHIGQAAAIQHKLKALGEGGGSSVIALAAYDREERLQGFWTRQDSAPPDRLPDAGPTLMLRPSPLSNGETAGNLALFWDRDLLDEVRRLSLLRGVAIAGLTWLIGSAVLFAAIVFGTLRPLCLLVARIAAIYGGDLEAPPTPAPRPRSWPRSTRRRNCCAPP